MAKYWAGVRCARCGDWYALPQSKCTHVNTGVKDMSDEEAERVRARYAIGKRINPDHDTTSYRDHPNGNDLPADVRAQDGAAHQSARRQ